MSIELKIFVFTSSSVLSLHLHKWKIIDPLINRSSAQRNRRWSLNNVFQVRFFTDMKSFVFSQGRGLTHALGKTCEEFASRIYKEFPKAKEWLYQSRARGNSAKSIYWKYLEGRN